MLQPSLCPQHLIKQPGLLRSESIKKPWTAQRILDPTHVINTLLFPADAVSHKQLLSFLTRKCNGLFNKINFSLLFVTGIISLALLMPPFFFCIVNLNMRSILLKSTSYIISSIKNRISFYNHHT